MESEELKETILIDDYLEKKLTPSKALEVEKRIATNPDFAQLVESHKLIIGATTLYRQVYLKEFLNQQAQISAKKRKRLKITYRRYTVAAASILFLVISSWMYLNSQFSTQGLVTSNIKKEIIGTKRSKDVYKSGLQAYKDGEYEKAVEIFQSATDSTSEYKLYLAKALLYTQKYEQAVPYLLDVKNSDEYFEQGQWHLTLAYLGAGEEEKAQTELNRIIEGDWPPYLQEEALQLRMRLNSPLRKLFFK